MAANNKKPVFILLASLLILLLVFLLQANIRQLLAEWQAMPARQLLQAGNDAKWLDRDRVYAEGIVWIDRALAMQVDNPEYHEIRGRLLLDRCRHWDDVERWDEKRQCWQQALDSLRLAVTGNSQWPYVWANLLLAKYRLLQFDDEFYRALHRCRELGASELAVNRIVAHVGLARWPDWPIEERGFFREALLDLQMASAEQAAITAFEAGNLLLYCVWTHADPLQHSSCRMSP